MSTVKADYLVNAAGTGAPTLTNGIVLPAGSANAPAISPTGDSNTGIFFPAADTIAFSEGGAEAMRIDSSGNVGIGTTTPSNKLDVSGTIGLPAATTEARSIEIGGGRTGNGYAYIDFIGDATYSDFGLRIIRENNGPNASSTIAHRGTGALNIKTEEAAAITFSTTATERMRIDSSGNLLFNSGYGSAATAYGCRAWVKFNSSGGVNGSGNVTSVTNNAVGSFTINFTTAMPDTNYAAVGSCGNTDVAGDEEIVFFPSTRIGTSTLGYRVSSGGGAAASVAVNFVSVFR